MQNEDDLALLNAYARQKSEGAFAALVTRHINMVYSAALRQSGNPHSAEEITQATFIILARKAGGLRRGTFLAGWLLRTARFAAATELRTALRRQRHEQEAYMESLVQQDGSADPGWEQIAPLLDEAMAKLGAPDRKALALRFFEQKPFKQVGADLGIDEDAAQKRVARAVDRLRRIFVKRGVIVAAVTMTALLSAKAVEAAPAGLAASVVTKAGLSASAATSSTATLIKGTLKLMAWTKAKTALVVGVVVLLAAGTATVTVNRIHPQEDYPWRVAGFDGGVLAAAPPQLAILPSKTPYGASGSMGSKLMGTGVSAQSVVEAAYSDQGGWLQVIVTADLPDGKFDYIASLPTGNAARLREEVRRQFGVTARIENRETNILALTVKNVNAPDLKPGTGPGSSGTANRGEYTAINQSLSSLIYFLAVYVKTPVIDRTGDTGQYDFHLKWDAIDVQHPNMEALKQALLDQLGLELVPATEPIKVLVIEKAR